jgi:GNAT superfamily N-acetyltransferase
MSEDLIIRPYRPEDAAAVRSVMTASYGTAATPAPIFNWWHFGCPVAASGFQVAEVGGRVVGVQPMEFFPYELSNRRLTGAMLTGVVVHPEYRRRGLFSRLVAACEREAWRRGADFVTTMPNERSRPGFSKLGYREPGRRQLLLRPLDLSKLARRAISWAIPARMFCSAGRAFGGLRALPATRAHTELELLAHAPVDLDQVNAADRELFPGLRLTRSRTWWDWRYAASPRNYQTLRSREAQGATAGLVTTTVEQRGGLGTGYIVDWLVRDASRIPVLLAGALRQLRATGAALAACVVSSEAQVRALRAAGFWRVPHWAPLKPFFTVFKPSPAMNVNLAAQLSTIESWHQTLGDWDNL